MKKDDDLSIIFPGYLLMRQLLDENNAESEAKS